MRRGVAAPLALVVRTGDDFPLMHHHCADRHVAAERRKLRFRKRLAHHPLVHQPRSFARKKRATVPGPE